MCKKKKRRKNGTGCVCFISLWTYLYCLPLLCVFLTSSYRINYQPEGPEKKTVSTAMSEHSPAQPSTAKEYFVNMNNGNDVTWKWQSGEHVLLLYLDWWVCIWPIGCGSCYLLNCIVIQQHHQQLWCNFNQRFPVVCKHQVVVPGEWDYSRRKLYYKYLNY